MIDRNFLTRDTEIARAGQEGASDSEDFTGGKTDIKCRRDGRPSSGQKVEDSLVTSLDGQNGTGVLQNDGV